MKILDVNAAAGFWPIQRFSFHQLFELDSVFEEEKIETAWVSAVESILYPEPESHDRRLFGRLSEFPRFRAAKTVNPLLANWKRSCEEDLQNYPVAALKLFPNYHDYSLAAPAVVEICRFAAARRLAVLIQMRVNDERNQPRCMQVAGVPAAEIADLSQRCPETVIVALCSCNSELNSLAAGSDNLLSDISFLDGSGTLKRAASRMPVERLVFGSHAPFLHARSAILKLAWPDLPLKEREAIAAGAIARRLG